MAAFLTSCNKALIFKSYFQRWDGNIKPELSRLGKLELGAIRNIVFIELLLDELYTGGLNFLFLWQCRGLAGFLTNDLKAFDLSFGLQLFDM